MSRGTRYTLESPMVDGVLHPADRVPQPEGARLYDYILEEYAPAANLAGRLHSSSALRFFLRAHDWLDPVWPMIEALDASLGRDQTVWGVKRLSDGCPGLELYFYNHCRNAAGNPKSVTCLARTLAPFVEIDSEIDESLPYLMCSLEIDETLLQTRRSTGFRVYLAGTRPKQGYDGISYHATRGRLVQENVYCFYRANEELELVRERLKSSCRAGEPQKREQWLDRRLLECFTICFATKADTDTLYFSRVRTDAASVVLCERMPGPFADMLAVHRDDFAHLRWDVGYDFGAPGNDLSRSTQQKIGVYGFC